MEEIVGCGNQAGAEQTPADAMDDAGDQEPEADGGEDKGERPLAGGIGAGSPGARQAVEQPGNGRDPLPRPGEADAEHGQERRIVGNRRIGRFLEIGRAHV